MKVTVSMFGPMRKYGSTVTCEIESGATVGDLRIALAAELARLDGFSDEPLLAHSVIATADAISSEGSIVSSDASYVVLPPVCGG